MAGIRVIVDFGLMVDDCWGILRGQGRPLFPGTGTGAPARVVYVDPGNLMVGWDWDLWQEVIAPLLEDLVSHGDPAGGWGRPESRDLVEARARASLMASPWNGRVRWGG